MFFYFMLFILSFVLTYTVKQVAIKKALVDIPNDRSSHTVPTPHGGGIAIAVTWFAGVSYLFSIGQIEPDLFYALMVGLVIALVSYLDDLYELNPKLRFAVQLFVALAGLWFLGGLSILDFGLFAIENQIIINTIAVIGIIWFINLYNFLDGIDGYAGSEGIFVSLAAFILYHDTIFVIMALAIGGFLVFNWQRASIFMGDVGSTFLGFFFMVMAMQHFSSSSDLLVWIVLLGLFVFDATITLFRRAINGEKLSTAHKKHAFQRVVQSGFSHQKTVLIAMGINILVLIALYFFQKSDYLFLFFICYTLFLWGLLKIIDKKRSFTC